MTDLLYMPDNEYEKEFEAKATKVRENDSYVVLDQTIFYKEGGGQPNDKGKIEWGEKQSQVIDVQKENGEIRHKIEGELPEEGATIKGTIDWERRHKHMRMHTAQHIISWVVLNMYDASTAGNQIHQDYSRIDFEPADFNQENIEKIEKAANSLIEKDLKVEKQFMDRELVEERVQEGRSNLEIIPDHIDPLRAVIIGSEDLCPCGGTHVDNLGEIGKIKITERKSKGSDIERIKFELEEA